MKEVRIRLGDILVEKNIITTDELERALERQKEVKKRLGYILIEEGIVSEEILADVLKDLLEIDVVRLSEVEVDEKLVKKVPENILRRHIILPLNLKEDIIYVAMEDPQDMKAIQDIKLFLKKNIEPLIGYPSEIKKALDSIFKGGEEDKALKEYLNTKKSEAEESEDIKIKEAPIVRLVDELIRNAVNERASDIHIEPQREKLIVRFRIDGVMLEHKIMDSKSHMALVSRIKIMSMMDISERRIPQDGRIRVMVSSREIDLRVSTMPTSHGEKIVIRILDRDNFIIGKEKLGIEGEKLSLFDEILKKPHGLILVTGPTGSGKTTTLYSMIHQINDKKKNVMTIEDPIEFDLEGVNQIAVNKKAGLTFNNGLRSMLRQDPDIIVVGEIRDAETAEIALRAALTGHLVLSTVHTNTGWGTIERLKDMGVEPFLIGSSLSAVVAQRLVRKICTVCKEEYKATSLEREMLGFKDEELSLYRGRGCSHCKNTGYRGRTGVFEIIQIKKDDRKKIMDENFLGETYDMEKNNTLKEDCKKKLVEGITSMEEYMRVIYTLED